MKKQKDEDNQELKISKEKISHLEMQIHNLEKHISEQAEYIKDLKVIADS